MTVESDLNAFTQNVQDCSKKATATISAVTALVSTVIVLGDKALPYIKQVIDGTADLFGEAGDAYTHVVAELKKLRQYVEARFAEQGIITIDDLNGYIATVKELHEAQAAAYAEAKKEG